MKATLPSSDRARWRDRVIDPVCQCSSTRPVESTIRYISIGQFVARITCRRDDLAALSVGSRVKMFCGLVGM